MKNILFLLMNDMGNMNVSILQNDYRIQNVENLLGWCLTGGQSDYASRQKCD